MAWGPPSLPRRPALALSADRRGWSSVLLGTAATPLVCPPDPPHQEALIHHRMYREGSAQKGRASADRLEGSSQCSVSGLRRPELILHCI